MPAASTLEATAFSPRTGVPWTQRWALGLRAGPVAAGALIAAAQFTGFLLSAVVERRLPVEVGHAPIDWLGIGGSNLLMALLSGYSVGAMAVMTVTQRGALLALRPVLELDAPAFDRVMERATAYRTGPLRVCGSVAVVVIAWLVLAAPSDWGPWPRPGLGRPILWWVLIANIALAWLATRMVVHEISMLLELSRIGARHARVDLWDPRPLAPFARRGLASVLVLVIGTSILSLQVVGGWASEFVPVLLVGLVGLAGIAFVIPVLGVHVRMRDTRHERLDALNDQARQLAADLDSKDADLERVAAARLPAVLALRAQVQAAREWPIDLPALGRFGLYVTIGLASWLGAALVERGLGALLD